MMKMKRDLNDDLLNALPVDGTKIMLCGEAHGLKEYYDVELALWQSYYENGCRDLFVELSYYSAEFLNIWMKESSNDLLDVWFEEISGTQCGNDYYAHFLCRIKESCPQTVFYGTDVGHQYDTTGERYLQYLADRGLKNSENYLLAEDCIRQGKEFYADDGDGNGVSDIREAYMVSNFKKAYARQGKGQIMGVYGSYHTNLNIPNLMAGRLKADFGDIISSVKIEEIIIRMKKDNL